VKKASGSVTNFNKFERVLITFVRNIKKSNVQLIVY